MKLYLWISFQRGFTCIIARYPGYLLIQDLLYVHFSTRRVTTRHSKLVSQIHASCSLQSRIPREDLSFPITVCVRTEKFLWHFPLNKAVVPQGPGLMRGLISNPTPLMGSGLALRRPSFWGSPHNLCLLAFTPLCAVFPLSMAGPVPAAGRQNTARC